MFHTFRSSSQRSLFDFCAHFPIVWGHPPLNLPFPTSRIPLPTTEVWRALYLHFQPAWPQAAGMWPRLYQSDVSFLYFEMEISDRKKLRQLHVFSGTAPGVAGGRCRLPKLSGWCCCVIWGDLPGYGASKPYFSGLPGKCFYFSIIFNIQYSSWKFVIFPLSSELRSQCLCLQVRILLDTFSSAVPSAVLFGNLVLQNQLGLTLMLSAYWWA